jgi:hypothetical protein
MLLDLCKGGMTLNDGQGTHSLKPRRKAVARTLRAPHNEDEAYGRAREQGGRYPAHLYRIVKAAIQRLSFVIKHLTLRISQTNWVWCGYHEDESVMFNRDISELAASIQRLRRTDILRKAVLKQAFCES